MLERQSGAVSSVSNSLVGGVEVVLGGRVVLVGGRVVVGASVVVVDVDVGAGRTLVVVGATTPAVVPGATVVAGGVVEGTVGAAGSELDDGMVVSSSSSLNDVLVSPTTVVATDVLTPPATVEVGVAEVSTAVDEGVQFGGGGGCCTRSAASSGAATTMERRDLDLRTKSTRPTPRAVLNSPNISPNDPPVVGSAHSWSAITSVTVPTFRESNKFS